MRQCALQGCAATSLLPYALGHTWAQAVPQNAECSGAAGLSAAIIHARFADAEKER